MKDLFSPRRRNQQGHGPDERTDRKEDIAGNELGLIEDNLLKDIRKAKQYGRGEDSWQHLAQRHFFRKKHDEPAQGHQDEASEFAM
jgi:hypothetical protein